ncbi:hypothetical protein A3844_03275 [Paenibacillus helianthi]|uniref:IDEAL domain-containing protein n=1 Tax=Paenibacillus helianthi TaxID=1349432 RepID=A0ABX3ESH1_9BACL|nr:MULTISPECIES: contact-dependent growth inhibition system immunity protein [Paenibacillus]OKP70033.1 hypothetical protein A3842_25060 [Paenibacillus sp. P3E]OKP90893.1 hypothetical protein A3844_03275 [Paenibacillus helianthi]
MEYRKLTIDEICRLEGFHEKIVVEKSVPLSGWFAGIMDIKLKDLSDGSIARLVRQNFHLKYVIPEAILRLSLNPLAGKHYEGELINAMNSVKNTFWENNSNVCNDIKKLLMKIENKEIDLPKDFNWYTEKEEQEFYKELRKIISVLSTNLTN